METDKKLKISIITVVRNGMPFLEDTILSVLNQDYDYIEYILVDGGSTDGTLKLVDKYKSKIDVFITGNDRGIADAFNKGLKLSSGDYIMFLNSDDQLIDATVISRMAHEIQVEKSPMLIYGDYQIIDRRTGSHLAYGSVIFSERKLKFGQVIPHPCLLTSRNYFDEYGLFDTNYKIAMDYEWLLRGIRNSTLIHLPILVTKIRSGGISTQNRNQVVKEIVNALSKNRYLDSVFSKVVVIAYFRIRGALRKLFKLSYFMKDN